MRANLGIGHKQRVGPRASLEHIGDRLSDAYRPRRYATLFYSVVFTIACGPLIHLLHLKMHLIQVFLAFNLLAAVVPINNKRGRLSLFAMIVGAGIFRAAM